MMQELFGGGANFVGRDGFYWWMGQIETEKGAQEKGDDRYKVRIVGQHLKDCDAVPYEDLPWAIVMMPSTAPRREGNGDYQSVKYKAGDWVVGFFLDGIEGQSPVIMGSIGQQYKASDTHLGKQKPDSTCLAFTTFMESEVSTSSGVPAGEQDKLKSGGLSGNGAAAGTNATNQPDLNKPVNNKNENASAQLLGTRCCNSETNPSGQYFCIEVADAKCSSTANDQSKFEGVLSELFANIQSSGGKIGTKIVSKYTGKLYDYVGIGQSYINKVTRLASSTVARVKGEIFALIKKGAKEVLDFLLTTEVVDPSSPGTFVGPYSDPNKAVKPGKKRVGRLSNITKWINDQLKSINCTMEDLDKRLMDFLTKLIFGALENVFNTARCYIDNVVNDILSQITSFLNDAINTILGPLQALLSIIASPLDILGTAIAQIFAILGITCGGPGQKCADKEQSKNCTGPCDKKQDSNYLDDLLKAIENGNLDNASASNCDTTSAPSVPDTVVTIIGGTPNPGSYTGSTTVPSYPTPRTPATLSPSTFVSPNATTTTPTTTTGTPTSTTPTGVITPSTVTPTTSVTPPISPSVATFSNLFSRNFYIESSLILSSVYSAASPVTFTSGNTQYNSTSIAQNTFGGNSTSTFTTTTQTIQNLTYDLSEDKTLVLPGDTILFTLVANGAPVPDNTVFNFALFGNEITNSDFQNNTTTGTMTMFNNVAKVAITIADKTLTANKVVTFNVKEAARSTIFTIGANAKAKDTVTPTTVPSFKQPVIGKPEVCSDGRIMEVPIISRGDAYVVPPIAVISGSGFGASAVVDLDEQGYIKKIRITRPGTGYAPSRSSKNCSIGEIVILNPGNGYFREPTVYVDGKSNVAKAVIDNEGKLIGIDIKDKTKTFSCTPSIQIFGGNGLGANAIPVMECRDDKLYAEFQQGIAPSGTDKVIDCP